MPELKSNNLSFWQKAKNIFSVYRNRMFLWFKKKLPLKRELGGTIDKKLIFSLHRSQLPNCSQLKYVGQFLSNQEKKIIQVCSAVIIINFIFLGFIFYKHNVKLAPASGGSYTEAITGAPKFINPLYSAINNVDGDLAALIYSSLLTRDKNGGLAPDLAGKITVSEDGKIYTFYLKENAVWHDKTPLTANDVVFTFQAIKNPEYKSPLRVSFTGVEIEKVDERAVKFILTEPYAAFLELLTFGILPASAWEPIVPAAANLAELNLKPLGSGPYAFKSLTKDKAGNIKSYELEANKQYFREKPYISTVIFKFFPLFGDGVNAINEGKVEGIDYLPQEYENKITNKNNLNQYYLTQPQFTALFFNQNNLGALKDARVRQALAFALDKTSLAALFPHTQIIDSPILPMFTEFYNESVAKYDFNVDQARSLLNAAGWQVTEVPTANASEGATTTNVLPGDRWQKKGDEWLTLTIATIDQPDTVQVAEFIKKAWEAINVKVTVNAVPAQLIQTEVTRPRNYQVLLYGLVLGADPDQYPFWHSSQIGPSGLNLTNYINKEVDILLEDGRITTNKSTRQEKYNKLQEIIARDLPAIFLYSQSYPYLQNNKIKGFDTQAITIPSDRFSNIVNWYINTRKKIVW